MKSSVRNRLFVMMVLEFFVWGAWLPLVWPYMGELGFTAVQIALVGSAFAIAGVLSVFFGNQFADRNFAAEKFMAVSHLIGGLAMLGLFWTRSFPLFFALMLIHSLFYVPTISVANSLAFAHLKDAQKEFGLVRMGGTIGWILASFPLWFALKGQQGAALQDARAYIFVVSAVGSFLLAAFSLTLPHTPPKRATGADDRLAWLRAAKLLATPFLAVLYLVTFIDATIHNGYFLMTGGFLGKIGIRPENIMFVMAIGQIAEILTMAILGWVLARLGWRLTLIVGVLGHGARFLVFALLPNVPEAIIAVQVLHGICYAFFFATVYIFIDVAFPKDVRSSAQGLFNLLILGLGDLAAKWIFVPLQGALTEGGQTDYRSLFLVPTAMSLAAALLLAFFFRPPRALQTRADERQPEGGRPEGGREERQPATAT
jgi:MFS family permease